MKNKILLITFIILLFVRCNYNSKPKTESNQIDTSSLTRGFQILENNCFSCHNPNASIDNRVAPPMEAIKRHYKTENISFEDFRIAFVQFLQDPSENSSKMPGALKKFGLMPKMSFSEQQLNDAAYYIYFSELEKPDWFKKHYKKEKGKYADIETKGSLLETGQSLAMQTKSVLGKNLMHAIQTKGVENAVEFCSTRAIFLTDSMAIQLKANIKRVSDKNRNPKNTASSEEQKILLDFKNQLQKGQKVLPTTVNKGAKTIGYYPILTDKMCLQCHGMPEKHIQATTLAKIKKNYPADKAIGYSLNEIRGMWVVEMQEK